MIQKSPWKAKINNCTIPVALEMGVFLRTSFLYQTSTVKAMCNPLTDHDNLLGNCCFLRAKFSFMKGFLPMQALPFPKQAKQCWHGNNTETAGGVALRMNNTAINRKWIMLHCLQHILQFLWADCTVKQESRFPSLRQFKRIFTGADAQSRRETG